MSIKSFFRASIIGAVLSLSAHSASALVVNASGEGWCNNIDGCNNTDVNVIQNTFAGNNAGGNGGGPVYRDWFSFNLGSVSGSVTSATISIWNRGFNFNNNASAVFNLYEAASISFGGLVNGPVLGSVLGSVADTGNDHYVTFALNAAGLAALTAQAGNQFTFGGSFDGDQIFGYTDGTPIAFLTIDSQSVPEPASIALLGIALLGAAGARRRRAA